MLENAAESPASGVSMKEQSTDCNRARFWIRYECSVNGNAYPGTLRKGPAETCMGSSDLEWNKPAQVFDCPVRIRLTGKLHKVESKPASVCDTAALKKRRARPWLAGLPA